MAEDNQYKGELWNDRAIKLLDLFNWEMIGDSGMDLEGSDGKENGVDCLYLYKDPSKEMKESLILEAKCYKTTSMSRAVLSEWLERLKQKITNLRGSEQLFECFPIFEDASTLKIGLIVVWFDDIDNYKTFRPKFLEMLEQIPVSSKPLKNGMSNKIYVIDNDIISKLCSLSMVIKEWGEDFKFYYPSSFIKDRAIERTSVLTLNYMFSKFILGKLKNDTKEENIVFYWGELNITSFEVLKTVLKSLSFIDKQNKLIIYRYKRDDYEFRKISPQIESSYKNEGIEFEFRNMDSCNELPSFIINDEK